MNILLVQLAFLGDVILTTPVIQGIKELYPESKLWFLTTPQAAGLLEGDPYLEGIFTYEKRGKHRGLFGTLRFAKELNRKNFDLIISVHKSYRTTFLLSLIRSPQKIAFRQAKFSTFYTKAIEMKGNHAVEKTFSILSFHPDYPKLVPSLRLFVANNKNQLIKDLNLSDNYIIIAPGSAWETKRWPAKYYRQVAEELISRGYQVVALGNKSELPLTSLALPEFGINLAGLLSLSESLAILSSARALICNDSMILHAASALKIPTVAIFCATCPSFGFGPWNNNAVIVEKEGLACKPCSRHGAKSCPLKTEACMLGLDSKQVLKAFDSLKI